MDKLLLTPTEAAAVLGIGRSKVYAFMRAGTLGSIRIDTCRVPAAELEALVERLRGLKCQQAVVPGQRCHDG